MTLPSVRHRAVIQGVVLALAVIVAYATVFRAGWLWDDDAHVLGNATIVGPLGLKEIWTTSAANYFPLVLTNFWLQHAAWGADPTGYHLVTLGFHAACAVLLWRVLLCLRIPGAWLGAALWALHPVQVESVAWVCELKNTQSCWFFLLAIYFFLRWLEGRERPGSPGWLRGAYALALGCAILALLSKPSTVMLPPVLALLAWWRTGRLTLSNALRLVPFFAFSALVAGWTIWEQKVHSGAIGEEWNQTLAERFVIAGRVPWFYLGKLLWPHPLIFIYPRWIINARALLEWMPFLALVGTLGALWWKRAIPGARHLLVALVYFGLMLFPILGFFSVYFFRYSFVGDHFQYLGSMGPLTLVGAALATGSAQLGAQAQRFYPVIAGGLVILLGLLTWQHSHAFLTFETLWRATLERNPTCVMAWINLAGDYTKEHRYGEAVKTYREALRLNPAAADVYNDLAGALYLLKQPDEARIAYERALKLRPGYTEAHTGLGDALHALGRQEEARAHYAEALRIDPDFAQARNNLGSDLAETGDYAGAIEQFEVALRLQPTDPFAQTNLVRALLGQGQALAAAGRFDQAIGVGERAVSIAPGLPATHASLGTTFALAGRWALAIDAFQRAITLTPADVAVRRQLAIALVNSDKLEEAVPHFETALRLEPASAETHQQFGQVLGALGKSTEAQTQFEEAARLLARPAAGP